MGRRLLALSIVVTLLSTTTAVSAPDGNNKALVWGGTAVLSAGGVLVYTAYDWKWECKNVWKSTFTDAQCQYLAADWDSPSGRNPFTTVTATYKRPKHLWWGIGLLGVGVLMLVAGHKSKKPSPQAPKVATARHRIGMENTYCIAHGFNCSDSVKCSTDRAVQESLSQYFPALQASGLWDESLLSESIQVAADGPSALVRP